MADQRAGGIARIKYKATERAWVARVLVRLTPEQRQRYEDEMKRTPGHWRSGKKYDDLKAEIAERIMYEDAMKTSREFPKVGA